MDYVEKWGDDIDSAVNLALQDLKLTRDEVDIDVLEQPSKGFLGIGAKLALVRVTPKKIEPEIVEEPAVEVKPEPVVKEAPAEKKFREKDSSERNTEKRDRKNRGNKGKKREGKPNAKPARSKREHDEEEITAVSIPELDFHSTMDSLPVTEDHPALGFLNEVADKMGLTLDIVAKADDTSVLIDISGKDSSTIIGKRGQTLDAIQYLTSLVVNKDRKDYIKVVIDVENYRSRREKTLQQLAQRLAKKVKKTRRSVRLEPMNPYERKVIHATLQGYSDIVTRSEGQDPYRRVVIELK